MQEKKESGIIANIKSISIALILAILFRTIVAEPFHIPSISMKPGLLVGDYLFVNKLSYGYSKYSIPFHLPLIKNRIFYTAPKRGDVAVFVPPKNPKIYYIKRIIGLPGDIIKIKDRAIYINDIALHEVEAGHYEDLDRNADDVHFDKFTEENDNGKKYEVLYLPGKFSLAEDQEFTVPQDSFFAMGDNRDKSLDSRYQDHVGYIPINNLVGKANFIFLSINYNSLNGANWIKFDSWKNIEWSNLFRSNRSFHKIK